MRQRVVEEALQRRRSPVFVDAGERGEMVARPPGRRSADRALGLPRQVLVQVFITVLWLGLAGRRGGLILDRPLSYLLAR